MKVDLPEREARSAYDLVLEDLMERDWGPDPMSSDLRIAASQRILDRLVVGLARHERRIVPDDGRDSLWDATEKAVELIAYLKNLQQQGWCPDGTYEAAMGVFLDLVTDRFPTMRGLRAIDSSAGGSPA